MKNISILILFLLAGVTAKSQTERGTILPGGSISFQTSDGSSVFSFSPSLGFFVADNFAVGTSLTLAAGDDATLWALGPFVKKYFGENPKGKFYLGASGNVIGGNEFDTQFGFGANAGYAFFLNQSIALELGVDYLSYGEGNNLLTIGTGFRIHFRSNRKKGN